MAKKLSDEIGYCWVFYIQIDYAIARMAKSTLEKVNILCEEGYMAKLV